MRRGDDLRAAREAHFAERVESRLVAALDDHPARERIDDLVAQGTSITVKPVGDGIYETHIVASPDEWYVVIFDTRAETDGRGA